MDADLRWNGPLPKLSELTMFVKEFTFGERAPYPRLAAGIKSKFITNETSMKNTSFFYWGSYRPDAKDAIFVQEILRNIGEVCINQKFTQSETNSLTRISEQIALSVLVETLNIKISYLKMSDGLKDGAFVESSYFGATGSSF